jgi:hypothetical protein
MKPLAAIIIPIIPVLIFLLVAMNGNWVFATLISFLELAHC